ncbi:MAG: MBL fold metallo-hydrolase, partial [Putridiphycobacter sp.]|nr:MBL fold metallo-hydrolase [Putridiphycobacter sp.]
MKNRIFKIVKWMLVTIIFIVLLFTVVVFFYMRQNKFGKNPEGPRLERIKKSPNYKNGKFQNLSDTPSFAEGYSIAGVMYNFLFTAYPRTKPESKIPSIKTNLNSIPIEEDVLVWFGHSSYYLQLAGKRILVDPVFSGNASPIPGSMKSFDGTDIYGVEDLPEIDFLLISHDHYDHVDYSTLIQLKNKVNQVICGLGVGAHFEFWGYSTDIIVEQDWYDSVQIADNFMLYVQPSRHFSGRGFSRNNTLWVSYVLKTANFSLFLGGDSGYDSHYKAIGTQYGPFDLAVLENGQYNPAWPYIHHTPEEVLQAAVDLNAQRVLPVHSSKFALSN